MNASSAAAWSFVFAGGGTGGHLFPALAIRERLMARAGPRVRCAFLCSDRPLDREILTRAGVEFAALGARPFGVRPASLVRFVGSWGRAVDQARRAIRDAGGVGTMVRVVAMGGFVAAPVVRAARALGVRVTLVNLDAVPGKANRWIARRCDRILTAIPVPGAPWELVGPIVRSGAVAAGTPGDCRTRLGLAPARPTLLVTGGSQGARTVNGLVIRLLAARPALFAGWQAVHQCGPGEEGRVRAAYESAGVPARVEPFIDAMGDAWGAADLAVSRAGAGSVAEAWANRVPTLFLPYPYHRDRHQRFNALPLAEAGAAVLADDLADDDANANEAGVVLEELLAGQARRAEMRSALERLGPAEGADLVARVLLSTPGGPARLIQSGHGWPEPWRRRRADDGLRALV